MADNSDFAMGYALGADSNDKNVCVVPANNGGWGGNGSWGEMIFAIIILAMFAGGDGFGNGGLFGGGRGGVSGEVQRGFDTSAIVNKLDGINSGLCDGFYAMNTSTLQGFHGVDNAVCNLGNAMQQGFNATQVAMMQGNNALQAQLASCCCDNRTGQMNIINSMERGFCQANYNDATNTTAIIQNAHNDTDRVIAKLDAMEMSRKDERIAEQAAQIQALQLAASQANQNNAIGAMISASEATILRRTGAECPTAAYIVQPPTPMSFPTNCCGQFNGWGNNGCGCNSGCGC